VVEVSQWRPWGHAADPQKAFEGWGWFLRAGF
jgi:hypothetical protein